MNNGDSLALEMLANALNAVTEITAAPPTRLIEDYDSWWLASIKARTQAKKHLEPPRIQQWERALADAINNLSFNEIRKIFPEKIDKKPHEIDSSEFHQDQANHLIHPRLLELEKFKNKEDENLISRLFLNVSGDRSRLHNLVKTINRIAKSKEGRLAYDQHIRHVTKSKNSAAEFIHDLFVRHGSLQVVRLVLCYKNPQDDTKTASIKYEEATDHWTEFRRQLGKIECAYIGKLAHSSVRSYYFHLVLFFPNTATGASVLFNSKDKISALSKTISNQNVEISEIIGSLWKNISLPKKKQEKYRDREPSLSDLAYFYHFNHQPTPPSGLGLVGRRQTKARKDLIEKIINPIFDMDLYMRLIPPKKSIDKKHGDRTYWKGGEERLPLLPAKRGRPRKQKVADPAPKH
ncbi:hypothetical protein V8Z74_10270 [Comamonas sp. w2-DMI]|uniref:hypothetical protein n=1 Tax=Comamonas sp. w2-DMI TaxID=3126391 RepID=UPI0032E5190F